MLKNVYLLAKIGADTAENEQHFAEILPIGRRVADHGPQPRPPRRAGAPGPARAAPRASGWSTGCGATESRIGLALSFVEL